MSIAKFETKEEKVKVWRKGYQGQEYADYERRITVTCTTCGQTVTSRTDHRLDHLEGKV